MIYISNKGKADNTFMVRFSWAVDYPTWNASRCLMLRSLTNFQGKNDESVKHGTLDDSHLH